MLEIYLQTPQKLNDAINGVFKIRHNTNEKDIHFLWIILKILSIRKIQSNLLLRNTNYRMYRTINLVSSISTLSNFIGKPSIENEIKSNIIDAGIHTSRLKRQTRQLDFNNEIIDPDDLVCLPRYECNAKQKSSLSSTTGDVGLVEKSHFKSSYLLKEVK